jgi:thiol:disulfide interchange protein DsbD
LKPAPAIFVSVLLLVAVAALPSAPQQVPSGRDVVATRAYASLEPVARGSAFQLAVVLKIRDGFHINARQPSADYLIATDLRPEVPAGFKLGEITYPKGELHTFSFSKKPLNVYEDKAIIRLALSALPTAPLGAQRIPFKLRYQACSQEVCLPPLTVDVEGSITVAANPAAAKPAHPELFQSPR